MSNTTPISPPKNDAEKKVNGVKIKYRVVWEKWADPYGENINEIEWPGWNKGLYDDDVKEIISDEDLDGDLIEKLDREFEERENIFFNKKMNVVMTPMGIVPLTEYTTPGKIFNFWNMHTNFTINDKIKDLVNKSAGVETLDVFTQYRARIGIGKVFDSIDVKKNIQDRLLKHMGKLSERSQT